MFVREIYPNSFISGIFSNNSSHKSSFHQVMTVKAVPFFKALDTYKHECLLFSVGTKFL